MRRMDRYAYDRMMRDDRRNDYDRNRNDYYQKRYDRDYDDNDYHYNDDVKRKIKRLKRLDSYNLEENNLIQKARQNGLNVEDEDEFKIVYYFLAAVGGDVLGDSTKIMLLAEKMLNPKMLDYDAEELAYSILELI